MGRLIYGFNVSVDGYIADAQGSIDWSEPSEELHQYWNDFERETALSIYGRRLYELMSAYWPTADKDPDASPLIVDFASIWRDMPKVVFSHTLESVDWNARLERGDPVEVVTKLKAETDGQMEVAGATLAACDDRVAQNSHGRFAILAARLPAAEWTAADAAVLMASHGETPGKASLCQHAGAGEASTISSAVFACRSGTLYLAEGNPCGGRWKGYGLDR